MPEDNPQQQPEVKAENIEKTEQEIVQSDVAGADVLEEDDDFEDFQYEGQFYLFIFQISICPRWLRY